MLRKVCVLSSLFFVFALSARRPGLAPLHVSLCLHCKESFRWGKIRVWIPAAQSDAYQEVKIVSAKGDLPLKNDERIEIWQSDLLCRDHLRPT